MCVSNINLNISHMQVFLYKPLSQALFSHSHGIGDLLLHST